MIERYETEAEVAAKGDDHILLYVSVPRDAFPYDELPPTVTVEVAVLG